MTKTSRPGASRSPDRKRTGPSGAPDVADQILNAAEFLFATRGFAGTTLRAIGERVDVTAAMVHYYFGTKKDLLQAVMNRVLEPMALALAALQRGGTSRPDDLVSLMFDMVRSHPHMPHLLAREVFLSGGHLQDEFLHHFAPRLGGRLPGMLAQAQQRGQIATDVDPRTASLLFLSLCLFPFIARPVAERALGISYDENGLVHLAAHITRLLARGFQP